MSDELRDSDSDSIVDYLFGENTKEDSELIVPAVREFYYAKLNALPDEVRSALSLYQIGAHTLSTCVDNDETYNWFCVVLRSEGARILTRVEYRELIAQPV